MTWERLAERIEQSWSAYEIAVFIDQGRLKHTPIEVTREGRKFFQSMAGKK